MRVAALSFLVAAPALVSAAVTPIRRDISGFGTWYYTQTGNAGSCGSYLNDADYTVAMNSFQYNDGMCGKSISITANGKTTQAKVMDLCPNGNGNCNYGDVDMSPMLFSFFADQTAGKIPISWTFVDDSAPAPQPAPTTTTQDYTPPVPSVATTSVTNDYVAVNDVSPTTAPEDVPSDPAPEPETTSSETPTTTESATPEATPTPTPPTLGEQLALAMQGNDVAALGAAFVEIGCMLQNSTNTST